MFADKVFLYAQGEEVGSADVMHTTQTSTPSMFGGRGMVELDLRCANFVAAKVDDDMLEEFVDSSGNRKVRPKRPKPPLPTGTTFVDPQTGEVVAKSSTQCDAQGHLYSKAQVVYRDGVCITHCERCEARAEIKPELGLKLLAMQLNALAMTAGALTPGLDDSVLPGLQQVIADVEEEVADLQLALSQAKQTEAMLKRRIGKGIDGVATH